MKRVGFKMKLNENQVAEYRKRHDNLWPELKQLLKDAGIRNYTIFWDSETNYLFAFQEVEGEAGSQDLGQHPTVQKWWDYMSDIMEVEENNAPVTIPLEEVFYLE